MGGKDPRYYPVFSLSRLTAQSLAEQQLMAQRSNIGAVLNQVEIKRSVLDVAIQHGAHQLVALQHQPLVNATTRIAQHQVFAVRIADKVAGRIQIDAGNLEFGGGGLLPVTAMTGTGQMRAANTRLIPDRCDQAERGLAMLHA